MKLSVISSKSRILLTEILINLELLNVELPYIYSCMFTHVSVNSNVIPPNLHVFRIPLIFTLKQLKVSEICMVFTNQSRGILTTKIITNLFWVQLVSDKSIKSSSQMQLKQITPEESIKNTQTNSGLRYENIWQRMVLLHWFKSTNITFPKSMKVLSESLKK